MGNISLVAHEKHKQLSMQFPIEKWELGRYLRSIKMCSTFLMRNFPSRSSWKWNPTTSARRIESMIEPLAKKARKGNRSTQKLDCKIRIYWSLLAFAFVCIANYCEDFIYLSEKVCGNWIHFNKPFRGFRIGKRWARTKNGIKMFWQPSKLQKFSIAQRKYLLSCVLAWRWALCVYVCVRGMPAAGWNERWINSKTEKPIDSPRDGIPLAFHSQTGLALPPETDMFIARVASVIYCARTTQLVRSPGHADDVAGSTPLFTGVAHCFLTFNSFLDTFGFPNAVFPFAIFLI